jgi:hypothetical protein
VLITNEFHKFCWSAISGTSNDGKAPYGPKSMHIFIMSKIRHSHRKYDTEQMMWHKARAQPNQGVADRRHHFGWPAMCWRISKNCFVYMSSRGDAQGIQCPKKVQGGNLGARPSCMAGRPDKWASCTQSSARAAPYSSYKYHGAPLSRKCEESEV